MLHIGSSQQRKIAKENEHSRRMTLNRPSPAAFERWIKSGRIDGLRDRDHFRAKCRGKRKRFRIGTDNTTRFDRKRLVDRRNHTEQHAPNQGRRTSGRARRRGEFCRPEVSESAR